MTREQIIQWYEDELARLRQAPHLNGCDMTPEWAKQIEVHTAAVAALREREKLKTPCELCRYNPPSSSDGKPCTMCPATPKEEV